VNARAAENTAWLQALAGNGPESRDALQRLAAVLKRNLARSVGRRRGLDDAVLEDFVQEALVKITTRLDSFRGDSRFTTWATAIAVRTALTALRRAHWKDVSLDGLALDGFAPVAVAPAQEHAMQRLEIIDRLHAAIATELTPRQREAVQGMLAGVPLAVMAERMGIKRNALYKLEHDARRKLGAALAKRGIRAADLSAFDRE
jgi:RNA polymerase sigma-70 factor (ECF subfamily)